MLLLDDVYDIMGEDKFAQVKTNAFKTYLVIYSRCRSLDQWTHPISDQQLAAKLEITVSTLHRHLKHLTNLNLIDKQKGQDTGYYCYRLIAS
jgi:DNA-binding MarR family transcriptional regulator